MFTPASGPKLVLATAGVADTKSGAVAGADVGLPAYVLQEGVAVNAYGGAGALSVR